MNSLEFIEKLIKETELSIRHWEKQLENYPNEEVFTICLNKRKEELQNLFQIKAELEAWEVIKKELKLTVKADKHKYEFVYYWLIYHPYELLEIEKQDYEIIKKALGGK